MDMFRKLFLLLFLSLGLSSCSQKEDGSELPGTMDLLTFSLSDGSETYDAFDISDGYVNVQVPDGTDMKQMVATFTHNGSKVTLNGEEQKSGTGVHDFSEFFSPSVYVVWDESGHSKKYIIRMFNLPVIIATTPGGADITSKEVWVDNCSFKIRNTDGSVTDYGKICIKGRGHGSWSALKKPYTIKLSKKQEVLGMHEHKRWCLLVGSHGYYFSNMVGFEIGRRAESLDWTPQGVQVEMILNNEHRGLYYLTEQVRTGRHRVNITEMKPADITPETITGGYLITYERYFDEKNKFRSLYFNMPVMIKSPDEDDLVPEQCEYIRNYINEFEASLLDDERFASREYLNYFDVDSYIDAWFVHEVAGDYLFKDFGQPGSVFFYKDRDSVIKSGPVWDFNRDLFYKQTILYSKSQYYGRLLQDPYFVERVKAKWPEFKARIKNSFEGSGSVLENFEKSYNSIHAAVKRDWYMWWAQENFETPERQYELISNGLYPKLDFFESYINKL